MSNAIDSEAFETLLFDLREAAYAAASTKGVSNHTLTKINEAIDSLVNDTLEQESV